MGEDDDKNIVRRDGFIGVGLLVFLVLLILGVLTYSGQGPYETNIGDARNPTLWDWMELLIVPAVLALGAFWLNKSQRDTELRIAEEARAAEWQFRESQKAVELQIAEDARMVDREIAATRQHQMTLERYFDRMTGLLTDLKLRGSETNSEERTIAKAITTTALRSLDGIHNSQLLTFIQEAGLRDVESPILDLDHIDLRGVDLSNAQFDEANLRYVNMPRANLSKSFFGGVDFSGCFLWQADMYATTFWVCSFDGADLSGSDLERADLRGADLERVDLRRAKLDEANLQGASLSETRLAGASMRKTKLAGIRNWTIQQLGDSESCDGALMPDEVQLELSVDPHDMPSLQEQIDGLSFEEWKAAYLKENGGGERTLRNPRAQIPES